jgi:hypothetical protein
LHGGARISTKEKKEKKGKRKKRKRKASHCCQRRIHTVVLIGARRDAFQKHYTVWIRHQHRIARWNTLSDAVQKGLQEVEAVVLLHVFKALLGKMSLRSLEKRKKVENFARLKRAEDE